ncbi:TPA: nucleotidyl transferase AbiEii/AbiGii toxin family protein, partial [Streptococcus agalactiae]
VYILSKLKRQEINFSQLNIACQRTFSYRDTELNFNKLIELLETFKSDAIQSQQWQNYSKKYSYTKGISFSDILDEIIDLLTDLNYENNH